MVKLKTSTFWMMKMQGSWRSSVPPSPGSRRSLKELGQVGLKS